MYTNHELSPNGYTCVTTTWVKNKTSPGIQKPDFPFMKLVTILASNKRAKLLLFIYVESHTKYSSVSGFYLCDNCLCILLAI